MAEEEGPKRKYRKLQQRQRVVSPEAALRFIKLVGYEPTGDPDVFIRVELRKTKTALVGNRVTQTIHASELIADRDAWARFVRAMLKLYPEVKKRLEEEPPPPPAAPPSPAAGGS